MRTNLLRLLFWGLTLTYAGTTGFSQVSGIIDQAETARQQREAEQLLRDITRRDATVAGLYPDEIGDVGPQSVLRVRPRPVYFDVLADSQFYYTDNMLFQEPIQGRTVGASVLVNTAQLSFTPPPVAAGNGSFWPRLGYRHQWYNYGLLGAGGLRDQFDFDASTVFADGRYAWNNWIFQAGGEYTRLLGHQPGYFDYDQFYSEGVPRVSVQRAWAWNERAAFLAGYQGSYHFSAAPPTPGRTDRQRNDRVDHALLLHFSYALHPQVVAAPYYRFQFSDYTHQRREDLLHSFGLSLGWFCTRNISLRGFVGYDLRESSDPLAPDYRKLDAGGGLNLVFQF